MGKRKKKPERIDDRRKAIAESLDGIEPELRLLDGVVALLRSLSESHDGVDPAAIAAVAYLADITVDRITGSWQEAMEIARHA